jgi:hypothetical protein
MPKCRLVSTEVIYEAFGYPTRVLAKASKSLTLCMVARKLRLSIGHYAAANDFGIYFTGRVTFFPLVLRLTFTTRNLSLVFYAAPECL